MDAERFAVDLGRRMRYVRACRVGLSLREVEALSGGRWKCVTVGSWERAERAVRTETLAGLAAFYGVPVVDLLPSRHEENPARAAGEGDTDGTEHIM